MLPSTPQAFIALIIALQETHRFLVNIIHKRASSEMGPALSIYLFEPNLNSALGSVLESRAAWC
jgi:hypothetical protein